MVSPERTLRADGQRNRERIIAAAAEVVAREGAQASLEEIARRAQVGSATLHRHFASRQALLQVLFRDGVEKLCARAAAKPGKAPGPELAAWIEELTLYTATHRGVALALVAGPDGLSPQDICCSDLVHDALDVLVRRALQAAAIHAAAKTTDLMLLTNAIAVATENDPKSARRLIRLALRGIWTT